MVIKYENGKIYKIIGNVPTDPCYVGSTTKDYLSQRMAKHIDSYRSWKNGKRGKAMSFDMFDKYGVENCKIILLEIVEAKTKDELRQREQYYIDKLQCVNKIKAYLSTEDRKQRDKQYKKTWFDANKDRLQIKFKNKYNENKIEICAKVKEYSKANVDKIRERKKQYALNQGKAKILAQRAKAYHCTSCNCEVKVDKRNRHNSTIKHIDNTIDYMKSFIEKYTEEINIGSNIIQHFSLE